jgi:hypothetical protein
MENEFLSYIYYFSHGHLNFIYVCTTVRENLGIAIMRGSNVFQIPSFITHTVVVLPVVL